MVFSILKVVLLTLSSWQVTVTTLSDQTVGGNDVQIIDQQMTVTTQDESKTLPLKDVLSVVVEREGQEASPAADTGMQIGLKNGSRLLATQLTASADTLLADAAVLGELQIPRSAVRSVRFQPPNQKWQAEWDAYLQRTNEQDMVIVPKRDGSGLDFLSGVVVSVDEQTMPFLLDGDEIPVPRDRVFGVVFDGSTTPPTADSAAAVVWLSGGIELTASSLRLKNDQLQFTTSWGQSLTVAADKLIKIDFTRGRLHYLSDLEPLRETYFGLSADGRWGPLFAQDRSTRTGLSRMWKMSRNRFPNNGQPPLSLRGRTFERGLCVFPSARIEYALDRRYSSLKAIVGVDDEVAFNQTNRESPTAVAFKVEADGQVVYDQLIKATAEPILMELNLSDVNTLALVVDFGDGSSVCDYLDIVNPTLLVKTEGK